MFPVIFIGLCISVVAVLAVFCAMFFSVAFESAEQGVFVSSPPAAKGLLRGRSKPSSRSLLDVGRNAPSPHRVAIAVNAKPDQQVACRHSRDMIPVTAPEVFAIADFLSMSRTREEVESIYQAAESNDRECIPGHLRCDHPRCPLLKADGGCAVHPIRPQYCRSAEHYDTLVDGSAHGMTFAVEDFESGRTGAKTWDAHYELNSARSRPSLSRKVGSLGRQDLNSSPTADESLKHRTQYHDDGGCFPSSLTMLVAMSAESGAESLGSLFNAMQELIVQWRRDLEDLDACIAKAVQAQKHLYEWP